MPTRAADCAQKPVYLLGAAADPAPGLAARPQLAEYASANFGTVARISIGWPALSRRTSAWSRAYDNFTGGVLMALAEHGFFRLRQRTIFSCWTT
jgi:hypothetical protein